MQVNKAEKKRLNETLSIRIRRIMQLEEQIGHASDYVASRDTDTPNATTLKSLEAKMSQLCSKLDLLKTSSPNNFYISSQCNNQSTRHHQYSQTPFAAYSCSECDYTCWNNADLNHHIHACNTAPAVSPGNNHGNTAPSHQQVPLQAEPGSSQPPPAPQQSL